MILYHGNDHTVTEPNLQTDTVKKEFGSGFYLTADFAQAAATAHARVRRERRLLGKGEYVLSREGPFRIFYCI